MTKTNSAGGCESASVINLHYHRLVSRTTHQESLILSSSCFSGPGAQLMPLLQCANSLFQFAARCDPRIDDDEAVAEDSMPGEERWFIELGLTESIHPSICLSIQLFSRFSEKITTNNLRGGSSSLSPAGSRTEEDVPLFRNRLLWP